MTGDDAVREEMLIDFRPTVSVANRSADNSRLTRADGYAEDLCRAFGSFILIVHPLSRDIVNCIMGLRNENDRLKHNHSTQYKKHSELQELSRA